MELHGGLAFGPRMLAEMTWIGIFIAWTANVPRSVLAIATGVTIVVGAIGLWRWAPEQWEMRRVPESYPTAYWDVTDSPLISAIAPPDGVKPFVDSPSHGLRCSDGRLTSFDE